MAVGAPAERFTVVLRDRDARVTAAFEVVFTAIGARIINTPGQASGANAFAGRWMASARRQGLDRMPITRERRLRLVLGEDVGTSMRTGRTGRCANDRQMGVSIRPLSARPPRS